MPINVLMALNCMEKLTDYKRNMPTGYKREELTWQRKQKQ